MDTGPSWWIGLEGWVLPDGNYDDFRTSQEVRFALEMHQSRTDRLRLADGPRERRCRYLGRRAAYEVTGVVVHSDDRVGVLDFGLAAYRERLFSGREVGDWLTGTVSLYVDPFMYRDELVRQAGMPQLMHTWSVEAIEINRSPLIEIAHGHPLYAGPDEGPYRVPDPDDERWVAIDRTDWSRYSGASYRLRCTLLE